MKTTISIPDDIFSEAEQMTRRLGLSRNQLYTEAVREYIARHDPDEVTEALKRIYETEDSRAGPFVATAARRLLERAAW